ncbi:hypothetical protein [Nostoc sp.]|uniref:hypothetical protein n=1 Tax=Nostoc sp. TaxID=1180 RepID=UPI002FF90859
MLVRFQIVVGCESQGYSLTMKINRHGRVKVLTQQEIQLIFSHGLDNNRDKTLFGVCLFSACRIQYG